MKSVGAASWMGILLLFGASAGLTFASDWAMREYQFRRPITVEESMGGSVCWVRFAHAGALCSDGRDIRVMDSSGKPVNHELLRLGPGDQAEILFESGSAQNGAAFRVYFGNPKAPVIKPWVAQAGVVLEVRKRAQGGCDSWAQYKKMFDASTELEGRVLRTKIFEGFNPVGPNDDWVSYYRAFFNVATAGPHTFATNSDDASFLLIDGAMVAEYPGIHAGWDGRFGNHNGKVELTAGVHKLEYYHVQYNNDCGTTVGWQPPGARHITLMPDSAYVKIGRARADRLETSNGSKTLEFSWQPLDHLVIDRQYLVRYGFECDSAYTGPLVCDFNDGAVLNVQKTKDRLTIRHGFLMPGTYTVTLSGGKDCPYAPVKQTVVVEPVWLQREEFDDARWKEYREGVMARLEGGTVRPEEILPVVTFAKAQADAKLIEMCAREAWKLAKDIPPSDHAQVFLTLGLQLQGLLKDFGQANSALQEATRGKGDKKIRAQAKLHRAGLLIHYFGRDQEGLDLLQTTDDTDLSPEEVALKQIYLADAAAGLGRREEAVRRYEALRKVVPLTDRTYAIGRRARLLNIRYYIRSADFEMALQQLQNIEWETPQERMADDTGLLRSECYVAQGDFQRASVLLNRLLKVNPTSPKVPEMRLLLMKAYKGMNQNDLVENTYATLKKESPYAAETALAASLLGK